MNSRERFIRTLTCNHPDRPSYADSIGYPSTTLRWEREGLPKGLASEGLRTYFELDEMDIEAGGTLSLHPPMPKPESPDAVIEETADWVVVRRSYGDIIRLLKNVDPENEFGTRQWLAYAVRDRTSWESFKKLLDPNSPGRLSPELDRLARESNTRSYPLGSWFGGSYGFVRDWMGLEGISYALHDDPGLVRDMVTHLTYYHAILAERIFASGVQLDCVTFWEDMGFNGGPLLSPRMYSELFMPFYGTLVDIAHRHGVPVIRLDSDGDINQLTPIWLDAGIQVMDPMEVASGMDVRILRRQYGTRCRFWGNIDKRALAAGRAAIDSEVIPKVRAMQEMGEGWVVCTDHGVPPDISLANFRYFRDLVRRLYEG
jgi:hypothetical protein